MKEISFLLMNQAYFNTIWLKQAFLSPVICGSFSSLPKMNLPRRQHEPSSRSWKSGLH